jgi:aspartyl-tRNA synthetase
MVAGFDRYFQVAPCYRDEDARADRSPGEFYQLDIEMSFVTQDELFAVIEEVMEGLFREFAPGWTITEAPFPRIPFEEAMRKYGSDKPDLRIPLEIRDVSGLFRRAPSGRSPARPCAPSRSPVLGPPRSFFDQTEARAKAEGAGGLAWLVVQEDGTFKGPIAKFLTEETAAALRAGHRGGRRPRRLPHGRRRRGPHLQGHGGLRTHLGNSLGMVEENVYRFCWITDFPMYEKDETTGAIAFSHNPFSMPQGGMDALNTMDPLDIKAYQYDIVCNGYELSSGAIRNHRPDIMYRAFEIAGYGRAEVDARFSGMINAFKMGAPPHGGIAPGVDRIVMLLAQEPNIREVIAFPMNQKAQDLMMGAPRPRLGAAAARPAHQARVAQGVTAAPAPVRTCP